LHYIFEIFFSCSVKRHFSAENFIDAHKTSYTIFFCNNVQNFRKIHSQSHVNASNRLAVNTSVSGQNFSHFGWCFIFYVSFWGSFWCICSWSLHRFSAVSCHSRSKSLWSYSHQREY